MLNDWEQQTLSQIERELERHDPGLANKFSLWPAASSRRRRGRVLDTFIGITTLISAMEVLVGSYSQALGFIAIAAAVAWVGTKFGATEPAAAERRRSRTLPPGAQR
jgi:hypothetical protein